MSDTTTHTAYTRSLRDAILAALATTRTEGVSRGGILRLTQLGWTIDASEDVLRDALHRMLDNGPIRAAGSRRPGVVLTDLGYAAWAYKANTAWLAETEGSTAPGMDVAREAAARIVADALATLRGAGAARAAA